MSLYWQQALPNGEQSNGNSHPVQNGQPGQWDYVNLGGAPDQQYQWANYNQQQNSTSAQAHQTSDPYAAASFGYQNQQQNGVYANSGYQQQIVPQSQNYSNRHADAHWTSEQLQAYYQQQQAQALNTANDVSVPQHTPILPKQPKHATKESVGTAESLALEATVVDSLVADHELAAPSSESSQVTPESTYSVDTFASGGVCPTREEVSSADAVVMSTESASKDDEWDDWEQTDGRETLHESSPSEVASQTQSEPVGHQNSFSERSASQSRESSLAPTQQPSLVQDTQSVVHSSSTSTVNADFFERVAEQQPVVAQVAPLVKKPSVEPSEQPIARVEPVTQSYDSPSNVQRVAPTRTSTTSTSLPPLTAQHQQTEQAQQQDPFAPLPLHHQHHVQPLADLVASAVPPPPPTVNHVVPSAPPAPVELELAPIPAEEVAPPPLVVDEPVMAPDQETHETEQLSDPTVDAANNQLSVPDNSQEVGDTAVTPDPIALPSDGESPGEAQATSTPITANDIDRSLVNRRGSSSSVHSGMPPVNQSHSQPQLTVPAGEQSDSTQGSQSMTRSGAVLASYHERYRGVKEKYQDSYRYLDSRSNAVEVMQRLERLRGETPRSKKPNPLVDLSMGGRRSALSVSAKGTNSSFDANGSIPFRNESDKLNTSFSNVDRSLDRSIDISRTTNGYGEDFVDAARRSRQNRSRPASRAKSEIGETAPYRPMSHVPPPNARSSNYDYAAFANASMQQYYPSYHSSIGRQSGRRSAVAMQYHPEYYQQPPMMYDYRRPQSSYDPRALERFQRAGGNYSTYDAFEHGDDDEESASGSLSDEEDDEGSAEGQPGGESEDEMSRYNLPGRGVNGVKYSASSFSMNTAMHPPHRVMRGEDDKDVMYYFGMLHLPKEAVARVFREMQPPKEFYTMLKPHEKAAYLYHATVYNKLFSSVSTFQIKFNREYFKLRDEGNDDKTALCKICKAMFDEYNLKRQSKQQKAYEAAQKHLFSDERTSADEKKKTEWYEQGAIPPPHLSLLRAKSVPDFLSDRASVYEKDDDLASDIMSVDTSQRAPHKHRTPHAFTTFGPGGKMVTVHPDVSVSMVQIDDVKSILNDNHSKRLIDAAQMFRGPLIAGKTPAHSVRLYIQRQIERIRSSEVAAENPRDNDVIDCLLVWQLLEMVVQQQGRVTGPDVARLLIAAGVSSARPPHPNHREKSTTPMTSNTDVSDKKSTSADPRAFERFTQFLLGGHIDEAVECALHDGLYADAMVLARRIFSGDARKLADIESRFLATRPATNPVMTLVAVASGEQAPILTNPPVDDTGSWRTHAAIVLANLNTSHAMETVYKLGRVLAKREYDAAADFCLLAVALLSNFDIFQPLPQTEEGANVRQHISLIHASLPDDEWDSTMCRFGFSMTDLHATEIFDYAIQLAERQSPLQNSIDFQRKRFQYARLLADYGGFTTDSFRYCLSVATSIWGYYQMMTAIELNDLAELADRLRFTASENVSDTTWIESLRAMVGQMPQSSGLSADNGGATSTNPANLEVQQTKQGVGQTIHTAHQQPPETTGSHQQPLEINPMTTRSRSESLATEAQDWHAMRQEPLQMSPRAAGVSETPPPYEADQITSPSMGEYQTPRADNYNSPSYSPAYGEQLCQQQQEQQQYQHYNNNYGAATEQQSQDSQQTYQDEISTSTDGTSSAETLSQHAPTVTVSQLPVMPPMQSYAAPPSPPLPVQQQQQPQQQYQQQQQQPMQPMQPQQQPMPQQPPAMNQQPSPPRQPEMPSGSFEPVQQQQQPDASSSKQLPSSDTTKKNNGNSSGFLSKILRKVIPDSNSMKLPDDKNPQIRWDPVEKRWVGDGVEAETVAAPPPKMDSAMGGGGAPGEMTMAPPMMQGGGLRAARGSGAGSRYFNHMAASSSGTGSGLAPSAPVPTMMPSMPIPSSFGFIPTMPDGAESVDPFSGEANPTVHGMDTSNDAK